MKRLCILLAFCLAMVLGGALPSLAQDMMLVYPSALTACEVDLTGDSGETINIFQLGDLSGPYAFITQPIVSAVTDAVNYVERPRTGVPLCGAELQQSYEDTGRNLEATQSAYDRFTSEYADDLDLLLLYSSNDGELLREHRRRGLSSGRNVRRHLHSIAAGDTDSAGPGCPTRCHSCSPLLCGQYHERHQSHPLWWRADYIPGTGAASPTAQGRLGSGLMLTKFPITPLFISYG